MSLPIISAAQERDLRGDYCLAALLRSFVTLLAACPQKSGVTALILARFYISTSRRFHCCGYWRRKLTGRFLIHILQIGQNCLLVN